VLEALLVFAAVGVLAAAGLVLPLVPAEWIVGCGGAFTAAGMLLGVPTGFWYHVKLRAVLVRHGELPARWWLRPVALHDRLGPGDRPGVMRWFYVGGVGFALTVLGCGTVALGVVMQAFRAGVL